MAKQGGGLNFRTKVDIAESKARLLELKRLIQDVGGINMPSNSGTFNTRPLTAYQEANLRLRQVLIQGQAEAQRLRNDTLALNQAYAQGRITAQQMAAAERQARADRRALADAAREARQSQVAANGSYDEAVRRLRDLGRAIRSAEGGFESTSPAIREQIREYNQLNDRLKAFDAQMGNHQRNVGNYKGAIGSIVGELKSMALSYISVQGALQLANASFQANLKLDGTRASLEYTLGTAEATTAKLDDLRETAKRLGLEFTPLAETYAKFAGAAKASNFPLEQADKIFNSVSGAAARFHLSSDQLSGALLALQQMISKGTVQSEELRGQLGERLPGAFAIAARAMGKTEAELGKMLQTGQVTAGDLLPKLATELDKTFSLDKSTKIDSLTASTARLKNTFDNFLAGDNLSSFFNKLITGFNKVLGEIDNLINGKQPLLDRLARGISLDTRNYDIKDAVKNTDRFLGQQNLNPTGASKSIVVAALADKPLADLKKLRDAYIDQGRELVNAINIYNNAAKDGKATDALRDNADKARVSLKQLNGDLKLLNTAYSQVMANQPKVAKNAGYIADEQLKSITAIRKRIAELSKMEGSAIEGSAIDKRIDALKERLKAPKSTAAADRTAVEQQRALQKSIDDLTKKGVDKQLTADQQEVASVEKKYADKLEAARIYNKKQKELDDQFIKQGKTPRGLRVNTAGLAEAESNEKIALTDKQEAEKLKVTLEQQKQLYADYEDYKEKVGEEKANERYGKELGGYTTFLQALAAKRESLIEGNAKAKGGADAPDAATYQLQLKEVDRQIAETKAKKQKADDEVYASAYRNALTHKQALERIEYEYQRDVAAIRSKASADELPEQLANLDRLKEQAIQSVNSEYAYRLSGMVELFDKIDDMTRGRAIAALDEKIAYWDKEYKEGRIKAREYYEYIDQLQGKKSEINNTSNNPFAKLSEAIDKYKKQLGSIHKDSVATEKALRNMFAAIADAASSASQVINDVATSLQGLGVGGDGLEKTFRGITGILDGASSLGKGLATKNPVDIITGSVKLLTSAVSLFNTKDKKIQKQLDDYKSQLDSLQKSYAQLERSVSSAVGNDVYSAQAAEIANLQQQQQKLIQMRDAEASKKKKDQSKIDEYNSKIAEIPNQIQDIQASISQNLIQGTFRDLSNSLADALTSAFTAGEDGIKAMNKSFDDFVGNAIKNSLKLTILDKVVNQFTQELADYAKMNNNDFKGFDFAPWKQKLDEAGQKFNEAIEASGVFTKGKPDPANTTTARGQIAASLTEDTGTKLYGVFSGTQIGVLQVRDLLTTQGKTQALMYQTGTERLLQLQQIQVNTANTVQRLDLAIVELKNIVSNTKPFNGRGAGLGG